LATFRAPASWTQIEIPLAELKQPSWGQKLDVSWTDVNGLALQPGPRSTTKNFDLWIDDLELAEAVSRVKLEATVRRPRASRKSS